MNGFRAQNLSAAFAVAASGLVSMTVIAASKTGKARICWEAEKATTLIKPVFSMPALPTVERTGDRQEPLKQSYSGDGYIEILATPGFIRDNRSAQTDKQAPYTVQAVYKINIKAPAAYNLWVRIFRPRLRDDFLSVSVNGGPDKNLGNDNTHDRYGKWHWVGGARVNLKSGQNTVMLKQRKTEIYRDRYASTHSWPGGLGVDQFFLSRDAQYIPVGKRTPTHPHINSNKICWEAEQTVSVAESVVKLPLVNKVNDVVYKSNPEHHYLQPRGYSGSGYLEFPGISQTNFGTPPTGFSTGEARYRINVKVPGIYYLWARTWWHNGGGNSIAVSINGSPVNILGEDGTYNKWHWVGGAVRFNLKAGENTVILKHREMGVCVDQFFLCQDIEYIPTGKRPPTQ